VISNFEADRDITKLYGQSTSLSKTQMAMPFSSCLARGQSNTAGGIPPDDVNAD
jgi:hypothetical protein